MLPPGLAAQPADLADQRRISALHPSARTVVRLLVGSCSCDLVRARHSDRREDERHHRQRYRRAGRPRAALIAAIDRHRAAVVVPPPPGGWPRALAAFVAEHARNAGETLYLLRFAEAESGEINESPARRLRAVDVLARPEGWLEEGTAVIVGR